MKPLIKLNEEELQETERLTNKLQDTLIEFGETQADIMLSAVCEILWDVIEQVNDITLTTFHTEAFFEVLREYIEFVTTTQR